MILRVFPRRTRHSPEDEGVRFGPPDLFDRALDIEEVLAMLRRQTPPAGRSRSLVGGLEARRLLPEHPPAFREAKVGEVFFAYDRESSKDLDELRRARELMSKAGYTRRALGCYVLIGSAGDTLEQAERRLSDVWTLGFVPFAMLYRGSSSVELPSLEWRLFARRWSRPALVRHAVQSSESRINGEAPVALQAARSRSHRMERGPEA